MTRTSRRASTPGPREVPTHLSEDDVERRLGGGAGLGDAPPNRRSRPTRSTVGRDTLTILGGALLALMLGNLAGFGAPVADLSSPTPDDSSTLVGVGSLAPHPTFPPLETLGAIVNPSTGFEATPTPIPIITLAPPTPSPTATPTPRPTTKPTPKPTPTPHPTPTPAPVAGFFCTVDDLTVSCDASASQHVKPGDPGAYSWTFGDGEVGTGVTVQHLYLAYDTYTVTLTVTGVDGVTTSTTLHDVTLTAPPPP